MYFIMQFKNYFLVTIITLYLYKLFPNIIQATPKCLLLGHTASIVCLVAAKNTLEMECIVSSSENGFEF